VSKNYGSSLTYTLEGSPSWMTQDAANNLSGLVPFDAKNSYALQWTAEDSKGVATFTLNLNINNKPQLPLFSPSSGTIVVAEGSVLNYQLPDAANHYGSNLTYSLSGKPDWVSYDPAKRSHGANHVDVCLFSRQQNEYECTDISLECTSLRSYHSIIRKHIPRHDISKQHSCFSDLRFKAIPYSSSPAHYPISY